jgi:hypothetical protein
MTTTPGGLTIHSMTPFYGCVSFGPLLDGRCGNCVWHEQECSFEAVEASNDPNGDPVAFAQVVFDVRKEPVSVRLADFEKDQEVVVDFDQVVADQRGIRS